MESWIESPSSPGTAVPSQKAGSRYTNAKVVLVGDTSVGKSGLFQRLIHNRFVPTDSTDAAWATQFRLPHDERLGDIDREIWLWDFAGQPTTG